MILSLLAAVSLVNLIVVLAIVGVVVWLFNYLIPMDARFKTVINVLIGLFLFLYVLDAFGVINSPISLR